MTIFPSFSSSVPTCRRGSPLLLMRLVFLLLVLLVGSGNGFVLPSFLSGLLYQKDHRQTQLLSQILLLRSSLVDDNNNNDNDKKKWTLSEDWALMDNVPRYTVLGGAGGGGGGDAFDLESATADFYHARTFWVQLGSGIPTLNRFTEEDLKQRYSDLLVQQQQANISQEGKNWSNKTATDRRRSVPGCFPSPPLLQDWSIVGRSNHQQQQKMMQGCLEDGRTIWFDIQTVGRLGDDPMTETMTMNNNNFVEAFAGGFVEATGGRVYELGMPLSTKTTATISNGLIMKEEPKPTTSFLSFLEENRNPIVVTIATAALSMALLSAAVGYGAGLALRHESTPSVNYNNPAVAGGDTVGVVVPNIYEQRAKMEAKVLQEQRAIMVLKNRIAEDRIVLEQLQNEEIKLGPEQAAKPAVAQQQQLGEDASSNRPGLSISEKRARMESRVLREERLVEVATKQLSVDGAQLQSLKQSEKFLMP